MSGKWYADFFQNEANRFWDELVAEEQSIAECDFLSYVFRDARSLLDVPSGSGRLAVLLAARGKKITAVDIASDSLERLNAMKIPEIGILQADMTELTFNGCFDGAYCMGNSFSYFDYDDMLRFVGGVSAALKKDALLVVNCGTLAESILLNLEERTWQQTLSCRVLIEHDYEIERSMLNSSYTFIGSDGRCSQRKIYHYIYTFADVQRFFSQNGMKIENVYSSTDFAEYTIGCPDCYIIARRCS